MAKNQNKISTSKLGRAGKLIGTGAKIGSNYLKYYAKSLVDGENARKELDEDNAKDVYETLNNLKGGPLKVAQMLSMGVDILPKAYTNEFSKAQNNVVPLSYPLVMKTFKKYLKKYPEDIFDTFTKQATNAASIGQVHKGTIDNKTYAVKVQYPGVADSLQSDLKIVKPLATQLLGLESHQIEPYMVEVEAKLLEETDYILEVKQSIELSEACQHIERLKFPKYYPELSAPRIITMDWMEGVSLTEWLKTNPSQEDRNRLGQTLWNFYQFQIHTLHKMHADPHPGNFIITNENEIAVIDFGCVKSLPLDFYTSYIKLLQPDFLENPSKMEGILLELELLHPDDNTREKEMVLEIFNTMYSMISLPLYATSFNFDDDEYFKKLFETGEQFSKNKEMKKVSARGSKHFIYFNRTYFGLYQLLHEMKANINTRSSIEENMG